MSRRLPGSRRALGVVLGKMNACRCLPLCFSYLGGIGGTAGHGDGLQVPTVAASCQGVQIVVWLPPRGILVGARHWRQETLSVEVLHLASAAVLTFLCVLPSSLHLLTGPPPHPHPARLCRRLPFPPLLTRTPCLRACLFRVGRR